MIQSNHSRRIFRWLQVSLLVCALLGTPFAGGAQAAPPPPSSQAEAPGEAPATPASCALLDDPAARSKMSGALETALLHACGRSGELSGIPAAPSPFSQVPLVLGNDVLVNNPSSEITSMAQSGTSIAYNETTGLLCTAYNDSYHGVVQGVGYTGFSSSSDSGATWVDHGALTGGSGVSYGYPSLAWRRSDGHFYIATLHTNGLGLWDLGTGCSTATWVGAIHFGSNDDKEMLAVDNNAASPFYGDLYVAWANISDGHIYFTRSGDGGHTWGTPVDASAHGQTNGASLAVDPANGDLYLAWTHWDAYPDGPIDVEMAHSTDGGDTWTPLANPMSDQVNPRDSAATTTCGRPALNGNIRYYPYPQLGVDHQSNLHVVYSYDPDGYDVGDVVDVYYRRSTDGGASWGTEIQLNNDISLSDQFFPTLAVGDGGILGVFWYDRRLDSSSNLLYDRYMALSHDGGASFESNRRISDQSSPVVLDALLAPCFHGDYDQAVAANGYFYTVWGDDRRGDSDVWSDSEPYFWDQLSGTLYDATTRHGLADGRVRAVHASGVTFTVDGDAAGYYAIPFPGNEVAAVTGWAYGYIPNTVTAALAGNGARADIPLTPAAFWDVHGQISDARTGYAVQAHVRVTGAPFAPPAPYNEAWSDGLSGNYTLPELAASVSYTLTIEAHGYLPLVYPLGEVNASLDLDFTLQPDLVSCTAPGYESQDFFADGFETGALGPAWSTSVTAEGRVTVSNLYPYAGTYSVLLDDNTANSTYSLAALTLAQNLSTLDNVRLDFGWRSFGDEDHSEDGVFISNDYGAHWYPAFSFNDAPLGFQKTVVDIGGAAAAHSLALNDHFWIKFQYYDNYPIPDDGYAVDEVHLSSCHVASGATLQPPLIEAQSCPCEQQTYTLYYANHTGVGDEIQLSYEAAPGVTVVDSPTSLGTVPNNGVRSFDVHVKMDRGVSLTTPVVVTVKASLASNPAIFGEATILQQAALLQAPWEEGADAPVHAFYRSAGAMLEDYAYIIGGFDNASSALSSTARYRPSTGWQVLDAKPTAVANIDAAELNGKIYVAGGYAGGNQLAAFEVLDPSRPAGSQWTTLAADLPVATGGGAMAAACDRVYFMGGTTPGDVATDVTYVYDPSDAGIGWQVVAALPQPQRYATAVSARGLIFVVGDWDTGTLVQVYRCSTNTWLSGYPQLAVGRQTPGVVVLENRYLVAYGGGTTQSFTPQSTVEYLDLDNLAAGWQAGPSMNVNRLGPGGGVVDGKLFAVGGDMSGAHSSSTVESIGICAGCDCGVRLKKTASPAQVHPGEVVTYEVNITTTQWLTGTLELVDVLPAGVTFAGSVAATYGTAWYSPTLNAIYWSRPAGAYSAAGAGTALETFDNTWATDAVGLAYNADAGLSRYVHEGPGPKFIHDIGYPASHSLLHSFNLSDVNPAWPAGQDWHSGAGYDNATGHYFLTDYGGGSSYSDNIVEIDAAGSVVNAWETAGGGNDSYDGSEVANILDIAVVPGSPTRYFATRLFDGGTVYELNLIKTGQFVPASWGTVRTCTVAGMGDTAGIDYDAQNGVLYHSSWGNETVVVTDLSCRVLETFTCANGTAGYNSGLTFIEGQWPPEVWVTDLYNDQTARCQAVGHEPAPAVVTVTYTVEAAASAPATVTNTARLSCSAPACLDPTAPSILLLRTAPLGSSLQQALDEMGYPYTAMYSLTDWSGIDFSRYDIIIVGMDGGEPSDASIQKVRAEVIDQGKRLIFFGGTASAAFVTSVNQYLVENNTSAFNWILTASPHFTLLDATSPLAQGLPATYDFITSGARYYQLRATDPALQVIAQNGDGFPSYFSKQYAGGGELIWFVHSPDNAYWAQDSDFALFQRIVANSLAQPRQLLASATFDIVPPQALAWTQEVYINGVYVGQYGDGPFTAMAGDTVQLVDRLDYTGQEALFVRLSSDWSGYPLTLARESHLRGTVIDGDWYVTLLPGTSERLVKTLDTTASVAVVINEELSPEGMLPEQRPVTLEPVWFVKEGPLTAEEDQIVVYTLTLQSHDALLGSLLLTDTLPAGLEYVGDLTASYGEAWYDAGDQAIYWANTPAASLSRSTLPAGENPAAIPWEAPAVSALPGPLSVQNAGLLPASWMPPSPSAGWLTAAPLSRETVRYARAQCPGEPDRFYVISGVTLPASVTPAVWRYDADRDQWAALAPLPLAVEGPAAVCYQGHIYVAGGGTTRIFYIYDIAQDTWAQGPALPRGVWGAALGAWDGQLFLVGGDGDYLPGGQSSEVDIYTIATGEWHTNGAPMLVGVLLPGWVQVNEYLYVVGGWGDSPAANINATQRYNMATDVWESGPTFTSARGDFALAATDHYLYAIGGDADGGAFFDAVALVERLDYTAWPAGAWTDIADPMPAPLTAYNGGYCTMSQAGGEVWAVGGISAGLFTATNQYRPSEACVQIPDTVTITFKVRVTAAAGETITNTAALDFRGTPLNASTSLELLHKLYLPLIRR